MRPTILQSSMANESVTNTDQWVAEKALLPVLLELPDLTQVNVGNTESDDELSFSTSVETVSSTQGSRSESSVSPLAVLASVLVTAGVLFLLLMQSVRSGTTTPPESAKPAGTGHAASSVKNDKHALPAKVASKPDRAKTPAGAIRGEEPKHVKKPHPKRRARPKRESPESGPKKGTNQPAVAEATPPEAKDLFDAFRHDQTTVPRAPQMAAKPVVQLEGTIRNPTFRAQDVNQRSSLH